MSHYNQPYSELKDIPLKRVMFYVSLYEAEQDYLEQEQEKLKAKLKENKR